MPRRVHVRLQMMTLALACGLSLAIMSLAAAIAASPALAEERPAPLAETAISGRWVGQPHVLGKDRARCKDAEDCKLTLDIVKCGEGWCGIEVAKDGGCLATALRLGTGTVEQGRTSFQGKFELARFTEPYVVEASMRSKTATDPTPVMSIYGNTGPELMLFRRTFPFSMYVERVADAACRYEQKTS